jgi:hypothetical protein
VEARGRSGAVEIDPRGGDRRDRPSGAGDDEVVGRLVVVLVVERFEVLAVERVDALEIRLVVKNDLRDLRARQGYGGLDYAGGKLL